MSSIKIECHNGIGILPGVELAMPFQGCLRRAIITGLEVDGHPDFQGQFVDGEIEIGHLGLGIETDRAF